MIPMYSTTVLYDTALSMSIIQYSSTVYKDHEGYGFLAPKYQPKTSLMYLLTSR